MIVIDSSGSIELFADGPHAHEHGLAMADSMMLAFARENDAAFVTTDSGFEGMNGVTVFSKKSNS